MGGGAHVCHAGRQAEDHREAPELRVGRDGEVGAQVECFRLDVAAVGVDAGAHKARFARVEEAPVALALVREADDEEVGEDGDGDGHESFCFGVRPEAAVRSGSMLADHAHR